MVVGAVLSIFTLYEFVLLLSTLSYVVTVTVYVPSVLIVLSAVWFVKFAPETVYVVDLCPLKVSEPSFLCSHTF